jgi:5-methylcytosine-specific restriction endonuclease McrA
MVKKKSTKPRKNAAPKTRNAGTLTESAFWSFIRSALRQKSRWWKPIGLCKQLAKRKYIGPKKKTRQIWEYQCAKCLNWFPDKEINVDHILPAGSLNNANDLPGFVERLFCEIDNLQVLCNVCHNKKTQDEKSKK